MGFCCNILLGNAVNQFFGWAVSLENDVAGRHLPILVAERLDGDHTVIAGLFHGCQISLDVDEDPRAAYFDQVENG